MDIPAKLVNENISLEDFRSLLWTAEVDKKFKCNLCPTNSIKRYVAQNGNSNLFTVII